MYREVQHVPAIVEEELTGQAKGYVRPDLFEIGTATKLLQGTQFNLPLRDYTNQWTCYGSCK